MEDEVMMVRIYIHEADHGKRRTLMQEVLNILHDQHRVQGVTVFRGIAGFGQDGTVYAADLLRLNVDLPIVIEFYDKPAVTQTAIALLDGLIPSGHIVSWRAMQHQSAATPGSAP